MREIKFVVTILSCLIFLMGYQLQAQVLDKGVTSSGKEVDCSTIDPSVDKTITEHGKIVTSPRVTRNGKIITEECSTCGIELSITDTVNCTSITLNAVITAGDPTAATLKVYKDAAHATQVGGNITATIAGTEITAVANNLNCHTRYYFVLEAIEGTETCTFDWTDSTRDMTPIAPTACLVSNILSNEHESATGVIDAVRDHEGNAYSVVQIGEQCWLKQNMRAITTPSGKTLALADKDHPYTSSTSSVPTYFINNTTNGTADFYDIYGCLYNWVAAMDTTAYGNNHLLSAQYPYRGICPEGWHIPSDDEFTTMANYVVSDNHYGENVVPNYAFGTKTQQYEGANTHISSMLGTDCWKTSTVDKSIGKVDTFRNKTSFSALPGGFWYNGSFDNYLQRSYFWTSSESDATHAYRHYIVYNQAGFSRNNDYTKNNVAQGVRCVRDVQLDLGNITLDTVACTFIDVKAPLLSAKTSQLTYDVKAYTDDTYTVVAGASQVTINATKDTIFAHISNLEGNTQYYIRATAKEGVLEDTSYFVESTHCMCKVYRPLVQEDPVNFRNYEWGHEANGIVYVDSVADHEGNRYSVCEVGPQCWIRENIRVTTSPSTGESILATSSTNCDKMPQARWQTWITDSATRVLVGPVYNWPAMVDYGVTSGNADVPEWYNNRKGLCPAGWHLQHSDEFDKVLVPNLGGSSEVVVRLCGGPVGSHSGDTDSDGYLWKEYTGVNDLHAGAVNNPKRNSSALTFRACGQWCSDQGFNHRHAYHFSSANQTAGSTFKYYWIQPTNTTIETGDDVKSHSHSMRCIRDGEISFSELVIDTLSCTTAKFHAKYNNGVLDSVVVSKIKAGASTSTEFIQNNKAASVRVSNDTVYAEITNLDCSKDYTTFYIKVFDEEYESYVAKATVDRDPKSSASRPCAVASARGNEISNAANQIDSVSDHENNTYAVVQIGELCWMKENLRTQSSPSGKTITKGANNSTDDVQHYYISTNVNSEEENYAEFGCLYNWAALMDTTSGKVLYNISDVHRGICPEGWHVPGETDWANLEQQIANTTLAASDFTRTNYSSKLDAGRLAASCDWGAVKTALTNPACYNLPERNSTLFSALPGGSKTSSSFTGVNANTIFWSAAEKDNDEAYIRQLASSTNGVRRSYMSKYQNAAYVRCVRDIPVTVTISFDANGGSGSMDAMHVITLADTVLNANTFTREGYFEFAGWNTDRFGQGTAYADRAHIASSESITLYAQWNTYCASAPRANERGTGRVDTVMDHEDNRYNVVQVGPQCWIRENLVTQTSPSTGEMLVSTTMTGTDRARKAAWFRNNETRYAQAGLLYNWCSIVDYADPNTSDFEWYENHQGICPTGWHAFSTDEWQVLTNTTTASELLVRTCGGPTSTSAADDTLWLYKSANGYPGSLNDSRRNSTGLSFIPAGHWYPSEFALDGSLHFYSVNQSSADRVTFYHIDPEKTTLTTGTEEKTHYHAARCIRDGLTTFSEITVDSISCAYVSFHATMHNGKNIDTKNAGASTHADYIKSKVAGVVDSTSVVAGDTVIYAHVSFQAANCGHTFYIYLQGQDGVDKQLYGVRKAVTLSDPEVKKATSCTVLTLNAGQHLGSGKYANREWGTGDAAPYRLDSISDHEGNVYRVVEMGNACWMKENMRARTQTDGTDIFSTSVTNSTAEGQKAYINTTSTGDPDFYEKYGCLYNWIAAMNLPSTNNNTLANPAQPHRGICPEGWHVPTVEEVSTMASYAISSCASVTGDGTPSPAFTTTTTDQWYASNTYVGQILSGGCDWTDLSNGKQVNPMKPYLNLSGLSLLPARSVDNGTRAQVGLYAALWTASEVSTTQARYFATSSQSSGIELRGANKYGNARSVRCVRDN